MSVTKPSDLANTAHDGDSPTTAATNALSSREGYPAQTADGKIVSIVQKTREGQQTEVLVDSDGGKWVVNETTTYLEPAEQPAEKATTSDKK